VCGYHNKVQVFFIPFKVLPCIDYRRIANQIHICIREFIASTHKIYLPEFEPKLGFTKDKMTASIIRFNLLERPQSETTSDIAASNRKYSKESLKKIK